MKALDLKPEWLTYLQTVARMGSFRAAARQLYMTEPTLRYNLRALEQVIQTPLFVRSAGRLQLSPVAQALLVKSGAFTERLTQVQSRLQALAGTRLELRVALTSAYPFKALSPLCLQLQQQFPDLNLTVNVLQTRRLEKLVAQGDFDLGLTTWQPENLHVEWLSGPTWPGVFVKLPQASVPERYFVPPSRRFFTDGLIQYPSGLACYSVQYIGSTPQILALCLAGGGIGYLPLSEVQAPLADGSLVAVDGPELALHLTEYVLAKDFKQLSEPAECFVRWMQAVWREPAGAAP